MHNILMPCAHVQVKKLQEEVLTRLTPEAAAFLRKRHASRAKQPPGGAATSAAPRAKKSVPAANPPARPAAQGAASERFPNKEIWRLAAENSAAEAHAREARPAQQEPAVLTPEEMAAIPPLMRYASA